MRRVITAAFLSFIFFMATSYSQEFTDRELEIYYKYYEKILSPDSNATIEEQDKAKQEIVSECGITVKEFDNISYRKWNTEPTAQDWEIYNKIDERLDALPEHSKETSAEIDREIANEYGMPVFMVKEISLRLFYYKYIVQPGQQND